MHPRSLGTRLEDGGGGSAAKAAGRVERVDAEELVDEAAGDAEHGSAAVLALSVELEGLGLGVVVAHPRDGGDVVVALVGLGEGEERRLAAGAGLLHAAEEHDLQPARGGTDSREARRPAGAARHSSVGMRAPASMAMTWRKPSMAARPCLTSMVS